MKITDIECHVLLAPDVRKDATSSAQDDIVVFVHTDEGITGVGETDVNPWIARACIEAPGTHTMGLGLKEMLLGENPLEPQRLWEKLYTGSAMNGRRGAVICAIGALDMALWDIAGKAAGKPCWELMGQAAKTEIRPYASLQPNGHSFSEYKDSLVAWAVKAQELGFQAGKMEVTLSGPYNHSGLNEPDEKMTEVVAACRAAVGPDFVMMVDVQYTWTEADVALRTLRDWADFDVYFVETPLQMDNLQGYAQLHHEAPMPIAAGEWQNTRFEFADLMDIGLVDVAQPDVGRVGGLTEALRVCQMAAERNRRIVPHCWKTGIGIAASAHLAAVTAHCPFIEFLPADLCDSPLRRELVEDELIIQNGAIRLPEKPGLGVEVRAEALRKFAVTV
ncbi:mandelate racemase/muconate lactonizing enzyme family protein [Lignipirellula cremea]|uniref:L-rhamnonate dehydratase n=1 Tax=Lignipirellula cremea TaxID=2528010 RepID=A0A518E108_9BACT|nr:mandelate racemase/muconate lactonizing enzyme family protein [Lignipirellula cremea]QDU97741.1 L-rhamnonate dehydratase [Lignipirellula cremea]